MSDLVSRFIIDSRPQSNDYIDGVLESILDIVKSLNESGFDFSRIRGDGRKTLLMTMASEGFFDICEYLVRVKAVDLNAVLPVGLVR